MKYSAIVWEENERPERLYQRLIAHLQDNLLTSDSTLLHDGAKPTQNEDLSPTTERLAVLHWMELIHPGLPALVQRTFAHDLQKMTLKDLQPQICDAIDSFLEELKNDDIKVSRANFREFSNHSVRRPAPARYANKPRSGARANPTPGVTRTECRV